MKTRVLHVIDHLGYGGAPTVVRNIIERLPADRVEGLVCALRTNPRPLPIRGTVLNLGCPRASPAAVWAIARTCRALRIDVVHAHLQKAVVASLLATYAWPAPVIVHEHGPILRGGAGWLYRTFLRILKPRAAMFIANSEATRAKLRETLGACRVPVVVVGNFFDPGQFDPDRYQRTDVRGSLGLGEAEFAVGFVGRLDRAKGADLLVEAAAILKEGGRPCRFLLFGEGPRKPALENRIRRLGLAETVTLAGLSPDPARVMPAFDVGVVPSRREGFGLSALEWMRMRVPVIVSPAGGLAELVRHEETGLVLRALNPAEIAESIRRLRRDGPLRERLCRNAFAHASRFDGRESVRRIVDLYESLR